MTVTWHDAAPVDGLGEGEALALRIDNRAIVLIRLEDGFYALRDGCTHGQARLSDGYVEDGGIECPLHQGVFDIRTGQPRSGPVKAKVKCYETRVLGQRIQIGVRQPNTARPALGQEPI